MSVEVTTLALSDNRSDNRAEIISLLQQLSTHAQLLESLFLLCQHQGRDTIVVLGIHLGFRGDQRSDAIRVPPSRRSHQSHPAIVVLGIHLGFGGDQRGDAIRVPPSRRPHQGRAAIFCLGINLGFRGEQRGDAIRAPVLRRQHQGRSTVVGTGH